MRKRRKYSKNVLESEGIMKIPKIISKNGHEYILVKQNNTTKIEGRSESC